MFHRTRGYGLAVWVIIIGMSVPCAAAPSMTKVWELQEGITNPESVIYDAANEVLYVVNTGAEPHTGSVLQVSLDGKVSGENFATGLNSPRGSLIVDNVLYVGEQQALTKIDLTTGKVVESYPTPEAGMLNDIAKDDAGNIYVSDIMGDAIYRLAEGKIEKWIESPELHWPNGLLFEPGRLVLAPWGTVTNPKTWETETPGVLSVISLKTKEISALGEGKPLGNLDGVKSDGEGNYFVSDWMTGKLYLVDGTSGEATLLLTIEQSSGDIEFIAGQNLLLVPIGMTNKVIAYKLEK